MSARVALLSAASAFLLLVSCSSSTTSSSGASATDPFVGSWSCTGTSATTYTAPPNTPPSMSNIAATDTISDNGSGAITTLRDPVDAGPPCTLHWTLGAGGMTATMDSGNTCTGVDNDTINYTGGTYTLVSSTSFSSTATYDLSGTTTKGATLTGSGTSMSTCTKM